VDDEEEEGGGGGGGDVCVSCKVPLSVEQCGAGAGIRRVCAVVAAVATSAVVESLCVAGLC
jgi:hypothetical protein